MAAILLAQEALWCSCGSLVINRRGLCARCNRRKRLSREYFGGLREQVLERDGRCLACGSLDNLLVHHRRPGVNLLRWLATLCRACHTRLHATWRPRYGRLSPTLRVLWREQFPTLAEQRELALTVGPNAEDGVVYQPGLFDAA